MFQFSVYEDIARILNRKAGNKIRPKKQKRKNEQKCLENNGISTNLRSISKCIIHEWKMAFVDQTMLQFLSLAFRRTFDR